ncbi:hypothetical protein ACSSS7_003070 [Eimeria intestinalis]
MLSSNLMGPSSRKERSPEGCPVGSGSRRPLNAAELDLLCDLPKICASSVDSADSKTNPGFFSGLLLRAEGNLRLATTSVTHILGPYTLPCLFLGGSLLGVATATAAFRSRMRISTIARAAAPPPPNRASTADADHVGEAKHIRGASPGTKRPLFGGWEATRAPSVLAAELRENRRERHLNFDEEADQSPPQRSTDTPPKAADLFTQKELAALFLLPASIILSVLAGSWLFLKYACDIRSGEHFMQLTKWLTGRGAHPDASTSTRKRPAD